MKKFFKRNWWVIVFAFIGIVLILLGTIIIWCFFIGAIELGVLLIVLSFRFRKRYNEQLESQTNDATIFDATKLDYDEDVYVLESKPKFTKQLKTGLISRLSGLAPSIICAFFGVGLIVLAVSMGIKVIF